MDGDNWDSVAMSFLPHDGGSQEQSAYEEISMADYEILGRRQPVQSTGTSYPATRGDTTEGAKTAACVGDARESCEIKGGGMRIISHRHYATCPASNAGEPDRQKKFMETHVPGERGLPSNGARPLQTAVALGGMSDDKMTDRERIARDVEAFLANGGEIEAVDSKRVFPEAHEVDR